MSNSEKACLVKICTNSVLSYIKCPDGQETVKSYLLKRESNSSSNKSAMPNYSEMLSMMNMGTGTTKEGVEFGSIYVSRTAITEELQKQFSVL